METLEALETFIKRADRIDVNHLTLAHIISVGSEKINILISGEGKENTSSFNDLGDGLFEIGQKSNEMKITKGQVYVEYKDVEIYSSEDADITNSLANLLKIRYEQVKRDYRDRFINVVERQATPLLPMTE